MLSAIRFPPPNLCGAPVNFRCRNYCNCLQALANAARFAPTEYAALSNVHSIREPLPARGRNSVGCRNECTSPSNRLYFPPHASAGGSVFSIPTILLFPEVNGLRPQHVRFPRFLPILPSPLVCETLFFCAIPVPTLPRQRHSGKNLQTKDWRCLPQKRLDNHPCKNSFFDKTQSYRSLALWTIPAVFRVEDYLGRLSQ